MNRVFVSYAYEDDGRVQAYRDALRVAGVDVWVDHEQIQHGDSIVSRINAALEECLVALIFFSENYRRKAWTNAEMQALVFSQVESTAPGGEDRAVLVVRLDSAKLPAMLSHRLWRGDSDPKALAASMRKRMGGASGKAEHSEEPSLPPNDAVWIEELDGLESEFVSTQVLEALQGGQESAQIALAGRGSVSIRLMPSSRAEFMSLEIESRLDQCRIYRRRINALQDEIAKGALGMFGESYVIRLEELIDKLDKVRLGAPGQPGLRAFLSGVVIG